MALCDSALALFRPSAGSEYLTRSFFLIGAEIALLFFFPRFLAKEGKKHPLPVDELTSQLVNVVDSR